jgi:opacity protein-like surface antigen
MIKATETRKHGGATEARKRRGSTGRRLAAAWKIPRFTETQTAARSPCFRVSVACFRSVAICLLLIGSADTASAQDEPKAGLTVAFPGAVGVLWQVSGRFAIRPDVSFSWSSTESSSPGVIGGGGILPSISLESVTEGQNVSVGVSALFTVRRRDALRIYVAPRVGYTRSTTTITTTARDPLPAGFPRGLFPPMSRESTNSGYSIAGVLGAQYALSDRFALFGEAGVSYSTSETSADQSIISTEFHSRTVGTRSGVGVIIFF